MLAITLQAVSPTTSQNPETIRCKKVPSFSFKINKENEKEEINLLGLLVNLNEKNLKNLKKM